jgi:spore coat polysaccharide biosynthesis protein SpsF
MMKVIAIVQARMASSRLPGKVLLELGGKPMLAWVIERAALASTVDSVVVATTQAPSDDPVYDYCYQRGHLVERGSVYDVLDRYYQAASVHAADIIVRITADCPLLDPELIDSAVTLLHQENQSIPFDFVANRLPPPWVRTYPIGLDIEVFRFESLQQAWAAAAAKNQREHVTPFFYEGTPVDGLAPQVPPSEYSTAISPAGYRIALMHHTPGYGDLRWTVDTQEDLDLVRAIVSRLPADSSSWGDVLEIIHHNPELNQINIRVQHKTHLDVDERT